MRVVKLLANEYSFVDNQTYPRPSHPIEEKRKDAFVTLVSIIISLRTTLENEVRATTKFFSKYKNIDDIISAEENEMESLIRCAGMPKQKVKTIKNIAWFIKEKFNGDINNAKMPTIEETRNAILSISGIGPKTADCLLELGFDMPSMVVDVNVFRVVSRLTNQEWAAKLDFQNEKQVKQIKKLLDNNIEKDYLLCQIAHTLLLVHGKNVCNSKRHCKRCIISNECDYAEKGC